MGCYVGSVYLGIAAYADDILLLAPRREVLQKMVDISENYMAMHKINFSPTKSLQFLLTISYSRMVFTDERR